MNKLATINLLLLLLSGLENIEAQVEITHCGQIITSDAVMTADLVCETGGHEDAGVEIRGSGVTLEMNGHTISGHPVGVGVRTLNVDDITIRNGVIEKNLSGIDIYDGQRITVTGMTIRNLHADNPDDFLSAIRVENSREVLIEDSLFEFLPVAHKSGMHWANSQVIVDGIEMIDGGVGIDVGGNCDVSPRGSSGSIINSRFTGTTISGVLVQCTEGVRIANNEFSNTEVGIKADPPFLHGTTGLNVEGNYIHGGFIGIALMGNTNSIIRNNQIRDNLWRGIFVQSNPGCQGGETGPQCWFSTGNTIMGNVVLGHHIDLYHRDLATGNNWVDNHCRTWEGAEIPACETIGIDSFETYPYQSQR
jgi:parallel beta-helix repeat protein